MKFRIAGDLIDGLELAHVYRVSEVADRNVCWINGGAVRWDSWVTRVGVGRRGGPGPLLWNSGTAELIIDLIRVEDHGYCYLLVHLNIACIENYRSRVY
jgi:hypothetical protein